MSRCGKIGCMTYTEFWSGTSIIQRLPRLIGLVLAVQFSAQTLSADSFFAEVSAAGTPCSVPMITSTPQNLVNLSCTGPSASITGSAKAGPAYLGATITGFSNAIASSASASFDMKLHQNQLAFSIGGDQVNFYWAMDGFVSIAATSSTGPGPNPRSEITFNVQGKVNNQIVLNDPPGSSGVPTVGPSPVPLFRFYSTILGTDAVQSSPTGDYDVFMGFSNNLYGSGDSEFYNTIQLAEITVINPATGQAVDGITFTDNFGDVFAANQSLLVSSSVPECSSLFLLGTTLLIFVMFKVDPIGWRKKRPFLDGVAG